MDYLEKCQNKQIFKEKTFKQLDKKFVKTLTNPEKEELKKILIDFSEKLIKGAVEYGAVYTD